MKPLVRSIPAVVDVGAPMSPIRSYPRSAPRPELFDLERDPGEHDNLLRTRSTAVVDVDVAHTLDIGSPDDDDRDLADCHSGEQWICHAGGRQDQSVEDARRHHSGVEGGFLFLVLEQEERQRVAGLVGRRADALDQPAFHLRFHQVPIDRFAAIILLS